MNEILQRILIPLFPALVASIITAIVTVKLSMKQFYSQRWWERKADIYSKLIERLSYLKYYYSDDIDFILGARTPPGDGKASFEAQQQSIIFLEGIVAMGEYLISKETADALSELLLKIREIQPSPGDHERELEILHNNIASLKHCIERIKDYAKDDLLKR